MNRSSRPGRSSARISPREVLQGLRDGNLRRLFRYVQPYRGAIVVAAVLTLLSTGAFLLFPRVSGQLVNAVTGSISQGTPAQVIVILIAVFIVRAALDIATQLLLARAGESVLFDLRRDVYSHLQTLGLDFFAARRTGELTSRLVADVTVIRTALVNNLANIVGEVLGLLGSAALIISINWRLTGVVLLVFPIAVVIARIYSRSLQPLSTKVQDLAAESSAVAEEAISSVRVVKSFGREGHEIDKYSGVIRSLYQAALRLARVRASFGPIIGLVFFFALVGILWFGSQEVAAGRLTAGDLVSFMLYGGIVAGNVSGLANIVGQFQEAVGATRRLFEILDTEPTVRDAPDAIALSAPRGQIELNGVSFAYENGVQVLRDINLEIRAGEILALVGPSGAGKSTIFNLIPRFYDPSQGTVCIDGHDLRKVTLTSLRDAIAIVPQDTTLFSGSVRENILYGRLDASEAELIAAAKAANAHDFIQELPEGYETKVGERGVKLSGGQRQRVAIARAILRNPRILLLDEATSSLDSESESLVQEALNRLMQPEWGGRTTIIIAHRLSTVHIAHRIAVLDKGQLVELGTHDELMAKQGLYQRLYSLQFEVEE